MPIQQSEMAAAVAPVCVSGWLESQAPLNGSRHGDHMRRLNCALKALGQCAVSGHSERLEAWPLPEGEAIANVWCRSSEAAPEW